MNSRRHKRFRVDSGSGPADQQAGGNPYWEILEAALDELVVLFGNHSWFPLNNLDIVGLLYHALLNQSETLISQIHLSAPVLGAGKPETYDLVIGPLSNSEEHRLRILQLVGHRLKESTKALLLSPSSLATFRPSVNAELILQVCALQTGQASDPAERVQRELARLRTLQEANVFTRGVIVFDAWNCLKPEALTDVVAFARNDDPNVRLYLLEPTKTQPLCWRRVP